MGRLRSSCSTGRAYGPLMAQKREKDVNKTLKALNGGFRPSADQFGLPMAWASCMDL